MNYYEHHLGDYIKDTAHLSLLEEGVYRRLIDSYYNREEPLPAELKECCKLARAKSKKEIEAVENILREFFLLNDDGYHQDRCDKEIARYHEKLPAAEAKKENERERQARARARRKALFADLLKLGITAKWDATTEQLEAELSRASHGQVTRDNTATSHQSPVTNINKSSSKKVDRLLGDDLNKKTSTALTIPNLTKLGVQVKIKVMQSWIKDGYTLQHITEAVTKARQHKPPPEVIPANYLDKIIREPVPWWTNEKTITAKMQELGLKPIRGETWGQLKNRIKAEIAKVKQ